MTNLLLELCFDFIGIMYCVSNLSFFSPLCALCHFKRGDKDGKMEKKNKKNICNQICLLPTLIHDMNSLH